MITSKQLQAFLYVAVLVWAGLLIVGGTAVTAIPYKPWSTAVGVAVGLAALFDKCLWRLRLFRGWFVSVPNLQGTWKGQLLSTYVDPTTKQPTAPREAYLVIRQTLSTISIRLITQESTSKLLGGSIVQETDGVYEVVGLYRNTPQLLRQADSPIHHGALLLNVCGNPAYALEGCYWTDRETKGELRFTETKPKASFDFAGAGKLFA